MEAEALRIVFRGPRRGRPARWAKERPAVAASVRRLMLSDRAVHNEESAVAGLESGKPGAG
jgi:hypothetical protein